MACWMNAICHFKRITKSVDINFANRIIRPGTLVLVVYIVCKKSAFSKKKSFVFAYCPAWFTFSHKRWVHSWATFITVKQNSCRAVLLFLEELEQWFSTKSSRLLHKDDGKLIFYFKHFCQNILHHRLLYHINTVQKRSRIVKHDP